MEAEKTTTYKFPVQDMKPGESFFLPKRSEKYVHQYLHRWKKHGTFEKVESDGRILIRKVA